MKKLLLVIALLVATTANAQWNHHHRPIENRTVIVERNEWIAPLIIGTIAGAVIANANRPETIIVQQPVFVQREQIVQPRETVTVCYGWKEIQTLDGSIYRERSCYYR
jgi:hypothetical protein